MDVRAGRGPRALWDGASGGHTGVLDIHVGAAAADAPLPLDGNGHAAARSQVGTVVLASLGAQLAAMFVPPLRRLLGVTPLTPVDCLVVAAGALAPAVLQEARRRLTPSP